MFVSLDCPYCHREIDESEPVPVDEEVDDQDNDEEDEHERCV